MDEPTNHLDLHAALWLRNFLAESLPDSCTLVVVSHDADFLDAVVDEVILFDHVEKNLKYFPGNYSSFMQVEIRGGKGRAQQ